MVPRIPPNLNTPFFHLLTIEELEEHRAFWMRVALTATNPAAVDIALRAARRAHNWVRFQRWRDAYRTTWDAAARLREPDRLVPLVPEHCDGEEVVAA